MPQSELLKLVWQYARQSARLFGGKAAQYFGETYKLLKPFSKDYDTLGNAIARFANERLENYIRQREEDTEHEWDSSELTMVRMLEILRRVSVVDNWSIFKKSVIGNLFTSIDPLNREQTERIQAEYETLVNAVERLIYDSEQAFDDHGRHTDEAWFIIYRILLNRAPGRNEYENYI